MTTEQLYNEIDQLPMTERWRLVNHILRTLEHQQQTEREWKAALEATYGILADDPIEEPEDLPFAEREETE